MSRNPTVSAVPSLHIVGSLQQVFKVWLKQCSSMVTKHQSMNLCKKKTIDFLLMSNHSWMKLLKHNCPSTASRLGHISHHHHPGARECGRFQQTLSGLFSGNPDEQVRGKDKHFLFAGTVRFGSMGLHRRGHPCGGHHDLPAQAHPGSALPEQCRRPPATFCLHFTSERHLDCLRCFCSTRWVREFKSTQHARTVDAKACIQ